ncbi:MAG: hypothetical protein HQL48_10870 [Gammaproteobacteria bacterium]|nr:hypothetical protein [Gammaproteobacteria bacterium]
MLTLVALWIAYFSIHSLLASLSCKQWVGRHWPQLTPYYRLGYNLIATVLLIPPLYLTLQLQGAEIIRWQGGWQWVSYLLILSAVAAFLWTLRYYDGNNFLGLQPLQGSTTTDNPSPSADEGPLTISPLHRFVRHPWYSLALILIWSRDLDLAQIVSGAVITLYFIFGSLLEERKLCHLYGERYRYYQKRVPGLIPLPWRYLSRQEGAWLQTTATTEFTTTNTLSAKDRFIQD